MAAKVDESPPLKERVPAELAEVKPARKLWQWLKQKDAASDFRALLVFALLFILVAFVIGVVAFLLSLVGVSPAVTVLFGALVIGILILLLLSVRKELVSHANEAMQQGGDQEK